MIVSLQYLRALAVFLVLLIHISDKSSQYGTGLLDFRDGRFGVDIFFIISGFVMYYTTLDKKDGFSSIKSFLKHRVIRIIPLYWFLTSIALTVYIVTPQYVNHSGGTTDVLKSYLLYPTNDRYLLSVAWTLSYEFYFYIIFSCTFFFSKYRIPFLVSAILLPVIIGLNIEVSNSSILLNFFTNSLLLEFLFGVFIAKTYKSKYFRKVEVSISSLVLFVLSYTMYLYGYKLGYRGLDLGIPAMFLVIFFLTLEEKIKVYCNKWIMNIGESSYSIYLTHLFLLAAAGLVYKKIDIHSVVAECLFISLMLIGSLLSGYITYHLIEKRFTLYLRRKETK